MKPVYDNLREPVTQSFRANLIRPLTTTPTLSQRVKARQIEDTVSTGTSSLPSALSYKPTTTLIALQGGLRNNGIRQFSTGNRQNLDEWLDLLKNAKNRKTVNTTNPVIKKAYEVLDMSNWTEQELLD